jgi:hypothetical protein
MSEYRIIFEMINYKIFSSNMCAYLRIHNFAILSTESRSSLNEPPMHFVDSSRNSPHNPAPDCGDNYCDSQCVHTESIYNILTPKGNEFTMLASCDGYVYCNQLIIEKGSLSVEIYCKKDTYNDPSLEVLKKYLSNVKTVYIIQ